MLEGRDDVENNEALSEIRATIAALSSSETPRISHCSSRSGIRHEAASRLALWTEAGGTNDDVAI
jgi:hypothetical protein